MDQVSGCAAASEAGKGLGRLAAALIFAAALFQSGLVYAAHGGGGGLHGGGGFHGGGGGLHGGGGFGGFHGSGFRGGGFHAGGFHGGQFHHHGFRGGVGVAVVPAFGGWWWGDQLGWPYYYNPYESYYGYGPYTQYWYYCSDPAGYYPYVTQCNTGWQPVPAG